MSAQALLPCEAPRRLADINDFRLEHELSGNGSIVLKSLLDEQECAQLRMLYADSKRFRSRVVMSRHGFGKGEYQYFSYPLPRLIEELRHDLYSRLAPIANTWSERLSIDTRYPRNLEQFLESCHHAGQLRPTPLLLKYGKGDYNRLHQDLYGPTQFPIQATVLLSEPGRDFTGGEFVLVENTPRSQSRAEVVPLQQGDMVIFAVNARPVASMRGFKRVAMRHGVSRIRSGDRMTLGLILHDAA